MRTKKSIQRLLWLPCNLVSFSVLQAVCPICTIAVGAGVSLSKWLGVDDTISGIWIGALTASMIAWTVNFLSKRNIRFYGRKILITILYYTAILMPLYYQHFIGDPTNTLWHMDKLLLGIIVGTITFTIASLWYYYLKKHNKGHAYFPFQKIVMPIGFLMLMSVIFYCIVRCHGK